MTCRRNPNLPLTERQFSALWLYARGAQVKEVAFALGIAEKTVDAHLHAARRRIRCQNRGEVACWLARRGELLTVEEAAAVPAVWTAPEPLPLGELAGIAREQAAGWELTRILEGRGPNGN